MLARGFISRVNKPELSQQAATYQQDERKLRAARSGRLIGGEELRGRKIPKWARTLLRKKPPYLTGGSAILFGLKNNQLLNETLSLLLA